VAAAFDFRRRLGAGNFGEVWLVTDTGLNAERALKLIPLARVLNPQNLFQEAQILKAVEHPNIVHVFETGTMEDGQLYLSMEYLPKGSLEDEAEGSYVLLTRAKRLMIDVLRGLEHAHSRGVIHRDIKPANILVGSSGEAKLSDFGLAIPAGQDLALLGAKQYIYALHLAPEVHGPKDYTVLTDIYACGVTLYRLVNGDRMMPPIAPHEARALALLGKLPDRAAYREFIPMSLKRIINKAIQVDPARRYQSASELQREIEGLTVEKNWSERVLQDGVEWSCSWNNRLYEVTRRRRADGRWDVLVRRGPTKTALRRISQLCHEGLSRSEAERRTRRTLQDFVVGKL
jgi:serine/threonine protein kinase